MTTGSSNAVAPTLFMKAESTPASNIINAMSRASPDPARRST